jgi:hypothetical protein
MTESSRGLRGVDASFPRMKRSDHALIQCKDAAATHV